MNSGLVDPVHTPGRPPEARPRPGRLEAYNPAQLTRWRDKPPAMTPAFIPMIDGPHR
jgi:hypothetical protein